VAFGPLLLNKLKMIILFTDEKIFASPHKKHVCTCIWNKKDITSKCFYTRI